MKRRQETKVLLATVCTKRVLHLMNNHLECWHNQLKQ
ncbi:hypothetical protein T4E_10032 [Trichinella pseudospiralis]|uniref:Uncharacterized protein n=1 Tax=Trichinella pseudospiralis TaxID=6337 RepID=A0A0V0XDG6_TRIPS|nr:hypothetical protein T4E_10032 [Trichinella pseudospiralis]